MLSENEINTEIRNLKQKQNKYNQKRTKWDKISKETDSISLKEKAERKVKVCDGLLNRVRGSISYLEWVLGGNKV